MSEGVERGGGRPARGYDVLLRAVRRAACEQELEDLRTLAYAHYVGGTIDVLEHAIAARRVEISAPSIGGA
jgi:hypothetical protein